MSQTQYVVRYGDFGAWVKNATAATVSATWIRTDADLFTEAEAIARFGQRVMNFWSYFHVEVA